MIKTFTAYCLILLMAVNALLGASGSAVLCVHDHDFSHFDVGNYEYSGGECHDHGNEFSHSNEPSESGESDKLLGSTDEHHCTDIVVNAIDKQYRRTGEGASLEKPIAISMSGYFSPIITNRISIIAYGVAVRGSPLVNANLDQCIRKTVLRI